MMKSENSPIQNNCPIYWAGYLAGSISSGYYLRTFWNSPPRNNPKILASATLFTGFSYLLGKELIMKYKFYTQPTLNNPTAVMN